MPDSGTHKKRNSSPAKTGKRRGKSEGAGAAFRRILLGQPESIDGKVGPAESQKEETDKHPRKRRWAKIEDLAEGKRNEHHHQREEKGERPASSHLPGEPRHRQAAENRSEGDHHDAPRRELRGLRSTAATGFGDGSNRRGNVHGSGPQTTD